MGARAGGQSRRSPVPLLSWGTVPQSLKPLAYGLLYGFSSTAPGIFLGAAFFVLALSRATFPSSGWRGSIRRSSRGPRQEVIHEVDLLDVPVRKPLEGLVLL